MHYIIAVGQKYPIEISDELGSVISFMSNRENALMLGVPEITKSEIRVLLNGKVTCGLLVKNSAILLLWQFQGESDRDVMYFETPFDIRLNDKKYFIDYENQDVRLLFTIHVVDSLTKTLVGLRAITMGPEQSLALLMAVQDQMASSQDSMPQFNLWRERPIHDLFDESVKRIMGL